MEVAPTDTMVQFWRLLNRELLAVSGLIIFINVQITFKYHTKIKQMCII